MAEPDRVRSQPARPDRPRPGGAGAGAAARPRARRARGHPRSGARRPAPPHRALLRRAQRRRDRRPAAGAGAGARSREPGADRLMRARTTERRTRRAAEERVTETLLAPPAARQGPGPLAPPLVEALDLAVTRLVTRTLPGDRRAAGVGLGTELAQLRPYELGDDVRHIDAAASARTGTPHVRLHVPERALTTWIVLDVSPSMAFGTARRLKADVAEGAALVFGRLGVRRAGSVGLVAFGAGDAPRAAAARLQAGHGRAAPDAGRRGSRPTGATIPRPWPTRCGGPGGSPASRAWWSSISDFRDQHAWERPLGSLRVRHSVLAVEVVDPREAELPAVGHLTLVDPETGARLEVNTSRRRVRERFAELERERRADGGRRAAPAARASHHAVHRSRTGSSSWGASCDELRRPALAAGAGAGPGRARRLRPRPRAGPGATRSASRRSRRCARRWRRRRRGSATSRPRSRWRRWRCWRSRWPARASPTACRPTRRR